MADETVVDTDEAGLPIDQPADITLEILRHSAAHLTAAAVCEVFPGAQYDVGPPIEDGFFYNFRLPDGKHFSEADLQRIEQKMREIANRKIPYVREVMNRDEARALFADINQPFKVDIIDRLPG